MPCDPDLASALAYYARERLIDSYLGPLRPGKEAQIHCCLRPDGSPAILKHLTPITERGFRADAAYGTGTTHVGSRDHRALRAGSRYGQMCKQGLWTRNEFCNLRRLAEIGLRVPEVLGMTSSTVLTTMVGSPEAPAPQLRDAGITRSIAARLCPAICADIERLLAHDLVHADLSPYNILWHDDQHWIIDTPQMVRASRSTDAGELFARDCRAILGFLCRRGADIHPETWANDTWERWRCGELRP